MIKKTVFLLSLLSFSASVFAGRIDIPAGTIAVHADFKAEKAPVRIQYFWQDGTNKTITVTPEDANYKINDNTGECCKMPQAGYMFKGLDILDYVRPNIALLKRKLRREQENKLPPLIARNYTLTMFNTAEGAQFYVNGNYAGLVPFKGKTISMPAYIVTSLDQKAFRFSSEKCDDRFQVLNIAGLDNPGKFRNAKVVFKNDGKIPFGAVSSANLDLGLTAKQESLYPNDYGDSGQTGRNAFDHAQASFLFTVPMKQYSHVWLLCAVDSNPFQSPSFTARLTRYVPSGFLGGRAYSALADTRMILPGKDAEQVGTVVIGKKTLPLWRVRVPLDMGKVIDLVTDSWQKWGRGAFGMHYLDFELMGENPLYRTPFGDPRVWPDPDKTSGVHVFGAALERSGMDVKFIETTVSRNMFDDTMKPEMKVAYRRVLPGDYILEWKIFDHTDKLLRSGSVALEGESGEKTIDLVMEKLGWYGVIYTVRNKENNDVLLTHNASFTLMGKDTRKAGWESPYIGWARQGTHYGIPSLEFEGTRAKMLGIRRMTGLEGKYTEKDWENYKLTALVGARFNGRTQKLTDEKLIAQITDFLKKYPHARHVPLTWEDSDPYGPYAEAPELYGEKPEPYNEARKKNADRRWEYVMRSYKIIPSHFPQLKILYGNALACSELVAEVLRRKPPKDFAHYIGTEAIQRTVHPEKPYINFTMMYSWQLNRTAELLGYGHLKTTCGPENISRKVDSLGLHRHAEWLVRDMLVQHIFGFDDIAGADTSIGGGNSYDSSFYLSANNRAPYMYPVPASSATGTLTKVLDCVKFKQLVPTGSNTVYCAEFERKYDHKIIYVFWTSRGSAELKIKTGSSNVELVEFHGNSSTPSIWFNKLDLTAGTAAQYVITDKPFVSVTMGKRAFAADPEADPKDFRVVDKLDSDVKWKLDDQRVPTVDEKKAFHRVLAKKASIKQVDDPEKGKCLELSIVTDHTLNDQFHEYMVIRPEKPILITDELNTIGMWVKANSGWGTVWWELEDANGIRRISSSTTIHGSDVSDYLGRVSMDYDSWCFLSMPVTAKSAIRELSTGAVKNVWGGSWSEPVMPCKLTGIYFCAPVKPLFLNEAKFTDQTIRIKDVSALTRKADAKKSSDEFSVKIMVLDEDRRHKEMLRNAQDLDWLYEFSFEMKTKQAKWYDNGFVFPNIEMLHKNKYDVVYVPTGAVSKNYMTNMKQYVENGGIVILGSTVLGQCFDRDPAFAKAFSGIGRLKALHEIPYTQKNALEHEYVYLPVMGKARTFRKKSIYAPFAQTLAGATPLIAHDKQKELFAATIHKYGNGYVIFCGLDSDDAAEDLLKLVLRNKN